MSDDADRSAGGPADPDHEELEARLSDYLDGALSAAEAEEVKRHVEGCASCKEALAELEQTRRALSGLGRTAAPAGFDREVAETIRRRSQGRFFGRRTFGDRVPLELLAIVALALGLALYFLLRGSETGSLRPFDREPSRPSIHEDARDVVPRP